MAADSVKVVGFVELEVAMQEVVWEEASWEETGCEEADCEEADWDAGVVDAGSAAGCAAEAGFWEVEPRTSIAAFESSTSPYTARPSSCCPACCSGCHSLCSWFPSYCCRCS